MNIITQVNAYTFFNLMLINIYRVTSFTGINKNKKLGLKYKQVNFVKGLILGIFFPYSSYIIYSLLVNNSIPTYIYLFGAVYASLDMSSTIYNHSNNHLSTNIHHTCVQLLYLYCIIYDWNKNTLCYPIILYASFSALSFLVNLRLSIRGTDKDFESSINNICLYS